jgi:hypothetical protein
MPVDPQDVRERSNPQATNSDQPTTAQRRICDLLSNASIRHEQLLNWIAQAVARALADPADQPPKGQNNVKE